MTITKIYEFEAAHQLNKECYGKCQNLHGHTYKLEVTVSNNDFNDESEIVFNFTDLSEILLPIIKTLDHSFLNDLVPIPTAEKIILWIIGRIQLPKNIVLEKIRLWETPNSYSTWSR